jgi:ribosome maturation factor RimP
VHTRGSVTGVDVLDAVRPLAEEACRALGLELWDVVFEGGRRRSTLFVTADKPGGITLDDCEALAGRLSALLDMADPIPGSYYLDVGSPGPERRLRSLDDVRRFQGERARVTVLSAGDEGRRTFIGRLDTVGETAFTLLGEDGVRHEIAWETVVKAHLKPADRKGEQR